MAGLLMPSVLGMFHKRHYNNNKKNPSHTQNIFICFMTIMNTLIETEILKFLHLAEVSCQRYNNNNFTIHTIYTVYNKRHSLDTLQMLKGT